MEMDWGTALIGLLSILICIAPFVILYYKRLKNENKMLQSLNAIAQLHKCKISEHEFCGDFVLGIDENKKFVYFFKQKREEAISLFVDLSEIQTCQFSKKTRNIKNNAENLVITEQIELCFLTKEKSKSQTSFELYNDEINMQLSGELPFADKWSNKINEYLKNK
jgi:hypothetical protein